MTPIDSIIVEVTVFPDRARVTRRGTLTLAPGTHQIDFADLPLTLLPDSIRAAGRGRAAASLLGVDTRRVYFAETPAAAIQELEKQIEELGDQDKALADQSAAAEMQAAFIKSLADKSAQQLARGLARGQAEMSQGDALLAFTQQQLAQAQATIRDIAQKRRELTRQLAKLNNDLKTRQSSRPRERYTATVEIEVTQAGDLTLDLTYMLNEAGWGALYDMRLTESETPSLQLSYLGQVTQRTGEDWNDVALMLSTARPSLAAIQPELQPWYLSAYLPPVPVARGAKLMQVTAAPAPVAAPPKMAEEVSFAVREVEMEAPTAQVEGGEGSSVTFRLPQTASIPSDGTPHKVSVATVDLPLRLDFISAPKLAEAAYRWAKITNRSDFLLLPGQASLFVSGDYVGALSIKRVAPNEEFQLALGVDDRIFVKRELKVREVDKKLLGDRRRLRIGYEIEIRNLRGSKIELEVHDQIPVSRHEQIKVKLESADPKPVEQNELNELEWHLSLEAGAKQLIRFDFSVEHPTSMTVLGLP